MWMDINMEEEYKVIANGHSCLVDKKGGQVAASSLWDVSRQPEEFLLEKGLILQKVVDGHQEEVYLYLDLMT